MGFPLQVNAETGLAKVIIAVAVILLAWGLSKTLQRSFRRLLAADERHRTSETIIQNLVRLLVWGTAVCIILDACFGLDAAGILGALGVVGIAVSLGAQQTIANVIGGIIISLSELVGEGDWIVVEGHKEAQIIDTNWRRTKLEDEDGVCYAVPNALMVSSIVEKGHPYFMIVVPFSLKVDTPDVESLLVECEQVVLERQTTTDYDYEQIRPKAHIVGASLGAIQCEMKIYARRTADTRAIERAILPALIELLQKKDVLAELEITERAAH